MIFTNTFEKKFIITGLDLTNRYNIENFIECDISLNYELKKSYIIKILIMLFMQQVLRIILIPIQIKKYMILILLEQKILLTY